MELKLWRPLSFVSVHSGTLGLFAPYSYDDKQEMSALEKKNKNLMQRVSEVGKKEKEEREEEAERMELLERKKER